MPTMLSSLFACLHGRTQKQASSLIHPISPQEDTNDNIDRWPKLEVISSHDKELAKCGIQKLLIINASKYDTATSSYLSFDWIQNAMAFLLEQPTDHHHLHGGCEEADMAAACDHAELEQQMEENVMALDACRTLQRAAIEMETDLRRVQLVLHDCFHEYNQMTMIDCKDLSVLGCSNSIISHGHDTVLQERSFAGDMTAERARLARAWCALSKYCSHSHGGGLIKRAFMSAAHAGRLRAKLGETASDDRSSPDSAIEADHACLAVLGFLLDALCGTSIYHCPSGSKSSSRSSSISRFLSFSSKDSSSLKHNSLHKRPSLTALQHAMRAELESKTQARQHSTTAANDHHHHVQLFSGSQLREMDDMNRSVLDLHGLLGELLFSHHESKLLLQIQRQELQQVLASLQRKANQMQAFIAMLQHQLQDLFNKLLSARIAMLDSLTIHRSSTDVF